MSREIYESIGGNGQRARADRNMGLADADHVEKERRGKDGPSASDQAERKADQRAAADSQEIHHNRSNREEPRGRSGRT